VRTARTANGKTGRMAVQIVKYALIALSCFLLTGCSPGATTVVDVPEDVAPPFTFDSTFCEPVHSSNWISPSTANIDGYTAGGLAEKLSPAAFSYGYPGYTTYQLKNSNIVTEDALVLEMLSYFRENSRELNVGAIQNYYENKYGLIPSCKYVTYVLEEFTAKGCAVSEHHSWVNGVEPNRLYLIVHNGYTPAQDSYILTTFAGETIALIRLKQHLLDNDIGNVLRISCGMGKEDIPPETPISLSYNAGTGELEVGNLTADTRRVITINYHHDSPSEFLIAYKVPGETWEGYASAPVAAKGWVTIAQPRVTLKPYETKAVAISLQTPAGVLLPAKWEFDIAVSEVTEASYVTETNSRFLITMN
jgi:hypothetical protein